MTRNLCFRIKHFIFQHTVLLGSYFLTNSAPVFFDEQIVAYIKYHARQHLLSFRELVVDHREPNLLNQLQKIELVLYCKRNKRFCEQSCILFCNWVSKRFNNKAPAIVSSFSNIPWKPQQISQTFRFNWTIFISLIDFSHAIGSSTKTKVL